MFDWNDEELANIIWGEAGVSDDHIVPYPEASADHGNKKEWNQEASGIKITEQKRPDAKIEFHGRKLGSNSNPDSSGGPSASGYGMNSWPDLSLSSAAKTDQGSLGTEVSRTLSEISKFSSSREETAQLGKDAEVFQNAHEGKEQGDFVDYGWANIGTFDDLDRILSNDDPVFSHETLDNADELWSSKDVNNSPAPMSLDTPSPAGALRNRSEPLEILLKAEYVQRNDQLFALSHEKIDGTATHDMQNVHAIPVDVKYAGGRSKPPGKEYQTNQDMIGRTTSATSGLAVENVATANELIDKVYGRKNLSKAQKISQGKQEGKLLQDFYGSWSPSTNPSRQFENQLAPSVIQSSPFSIIGKQKQIEGDETLYQNMMNPYVASPVYGNLANIYPAIPMLSQAQSGDPRHQPLLSGYKVSSGIVKPVKKSVDSVKPLTMTPQEKIEKLRRRQQLQAMLAIQNQQQQLSHQVPSINKSISQKCPPGMQSRPCDGVDPEIEDLSTLPAPDPPIEQDDSNTISVAVDDYFDEDTILYRLQDIISKLDIKIRLCIRDSLFRLAQSAMERNYASDTISTNRSTREELEVVAREEINYQNRYARMPHVETETNPIDRTVAHLLFHRPLESTGNYPDKLDSPISAKMQSGRKSANLLNLTMKCLPDEDLKSNQQFSHQRFKFRNSPCIDTSENASNNGPADVGAQELEASQ